MSLKGEVREETVIAKRDGETARTEHHKEEDDLKEINAVEPDVNRDGRQREKKGANQKRTGGPVDFVERNSRKHVRRCGYSPRKREGFSRC